MDTSIVDNQIALFLEKRDQIIYEQLVLDIKTALKDIRFVSPSVILPIPPDAPPEIPRVIMESFDKRVKITISNNRCDFTYSYKDTSNTTLIDENIKDIASNLANIFHKHKYLFRRIGLVSRYFVLVDNPVKLIQKSLTKVDDKDIIEISIRINRRKQYDIFEVNDVTSYDKAIKATEMKDGILISRDINTLHEKRTIMTINDITKFINIIIDEINRDDPIKELANER